jgi:hypothetical protein
MPKSSVRSTAPPPGDDPVRKIELPRETGAHGDVLAAIGLASLLEEATANGRIDIEQRGANFAVIPSRIRRPSEMTSIPHAPGYRYLQSKSSVALPDNVTPANAVDYQATRDAIKDLRLQESELHKLIANTKDDAQRQVLRDQIGELRQQWPVEPDAWRRYAPYLMLQGHETANKLLTEIVKAPETQFLDLIRCSLAALAGRRPTGVEWKVSTVQLFSPNAAKGYARLKPDSTGRGDKTKDAWADPFVEWLRYRGYFSAAVPAFHGSKGEHIRILVPVPGSVTLRVYQDIVREIPTPPRGSSPPKIDSLATLDIARLLIRRSQQFQQAVSDDDDELLDLEDQTPADVISGLAVTNYQSLGSARAVSLMSELAVPGWFTIKTPEDAIDWLAILDEHRAIVRELKDDHSDELTLLLGYRRFLEQRGDEHGNESALDALLDFASAYGGFIIRAREAGRRVRQFRADLFQKVVESMSTTYGAILSDPGFKAVAAAVRRATVSAQSRKARREEYREIRYGLLPDLRRASQLDDKRALMIAVAEFVDVYNAENARREEATGRAWHARVSVTELASFARLVDDADGASIVGALLCAYGTCTERREPTTSAPDAAGAGDEPVAIDEADVSSDPESEDGE